jgi:hypothetical protein
MWRNEKLNIKIPTDKKLQELYLFLKCAKTFKKSLAQITSKKRWNQFIHQWFDAFKTLKTIHFFDKKLPRLNYIQLLKSDSFAKVSNSKLNQFINNNDKNKSSINPPNN